MPTFGPTKLLVHPLFGVHKRDARHELLFGFFISAGLLAGLSLLAKRLEFGLDPCVVFALGAEFFAEGVIAASATIYPFFGLIAFKFLPCLGVIPAFVVDSSGICPFGPFFIGVEDLLIIRFIDVSRSDHDLLPYRYFLGSSIPRK